jgi:hypothetical protein
MLRGLTEPVRFVRVVADDDVPGARAPRSHEAPD